MASRIDRGRTEVDHHGDAKPHEAHRREQLQHFLEGGVVSGLRAVAQRNAEAAGHCERDAAYIKAVPFLSKDRRREQQVEESREPRGRGSE